MKTKENERERGGRRRERSESKLSARNIQHAMNVCVSLCAGDIGFQVHMYVGLKFDAELVKEMKEVCVWCLLSLSLCAQALAC